MKNKAFTLPKVWHRDRGPKFPRKLKKKLKKLRPGSDLTLNQLYWEYIGIVNPAYKQFLINKVFEYEDK